MARIGRPFLHTNPSKIEEISDRFFKKCDKNKKPYTITGLALALNTSRKTLMQWEGREDIGNAIKKGKDRCENYAEERLFMPNPTGAIFALKNFDWTDRQEFTGKDGNIIEVGVIHLPQRVKNSMASP